MRRKLLVLVLFLPLFAEAQTTRDSLKKKIADTSFICPDIYAYGEALGPGRFFSINGEKQLFRWKGYTRALYIRAGFQWLPDLTARYTVSLLGGLNFESGKKNWSRDFGIGVTSWIDHYNWKRTDTLSTECHGPSNCSPTLLWGPYLTLGGRYRWDNEVFCGFSFTPMFLKGKDGWNITPSVGATVGFMINPAYSRRKASVKDREIETNH